MATITETNGMITIKQAPSLYGVDEAIFWVIRKTRGTEYFYKWWGHHNTEAIDSLEQAYRFGTAKEAEDFRRDKLGYMWETIKVVLTTR